MSATTPTEKTTTEPSGAVAPLGYKRIPLSPTGELLKAGVEILSPRNMVIVKYPKSGTTLSMCNVPKILVADAEEGTVTFKMDNQTDLFDKSAEDKFTKTNSYGWLPQTIFELVDELKRANRMKEFWELHQAMRSERDPTKRIDLYKRVIVLINSMPFPIVAIDTITSIQKLSNAAALYEYNQGVGKANPKNDITKVDEYAGSKYVRGKFAEIKRFIETNAAPFIQYHGHVAERKKILKKDDQDISAVDIALSGIQAVTFTSWAQAVATFYRNKEGCWLDFTKKDETDMGSRILALSNRKLKIADIVSDEDLMKGIRPKTYWGTIYPEIEALKGK